MSVVTISVPATLGTSRQITGTEHGPFIVHRNAMSAAVDDLDVDTWSVTHKTNGVRFPWSFFAEEAAIAFAADVLPIMDWNNISVAPQLDKSDVKAQWIAGTPTKEQAATVRAAAAAHGGLKMANVIPDQSRA